MNGLFLAKPIFPTAITSTEMNALFLNALLRVKENVELDYSATIATWTTHHPTFKVRVRYSGGSARVIGGTSDYNLDNRIWNWIDAGTNTRHAVMSDPFHPKTRKRNIGSMAGMGKAVKVSRNINLPGIEAREFTEAIEENNIDLLKSEIDKAVAKAIRGAGPFRF